MGRQVRAGLAVVTGLATMGAGIMLALSSAAAVASPPKLAAHTVAPVVSPSSTPAYGADSGDPNVIQSNGVYYDFSTGTPLGNHIQALVNTSGNPLTGYASYTGQAYGSSALPDTPAWEQPNTQTSPGVFFWNNEWIMYYDAAPSGYASDTGHDCLSYATASTISPSAPVFTDTAPPQWYCSPAQSGVIDPSPFIDPATGAAYLVVEVERRRLVGRSHYLGRPAQLDWYGFRWDADPAHVQQHGDQSVGDHGGEPTDGGRERELRASVLGRGVGLGHLRGGLRPL